MTLRRRVLWVLLFALIAAQTLGLVHRAAHSPQLLHATSSAHTNNTLATGWVKSLFSAHEGEAGCRLFDQLNASGMLPSLPALSLPAVLPHYFLRWYQSQALARWVALFDARGPPSLR